MKNIHLLVFCIFLAGCQPATDINILNHAIKTNNKKLFDELITNADVNTAGIDGHTPLITAATEGNVELGKLLIKKGAKVNHQEVKQIAPAIYHASYTGNTDFVELLLDNGAKVDLDIGKTTALMGASIYCYPDTVALLLKNGADKNAADAFGETALSTLEPFANARKGEFYERCKQTVKLLKQ